MTPEPQAMTTTSERCETVQGRLSDALLARAAAARLPAGKAALLGNGLEGLHVGLVPSPALWFWLEAGKIEIVFEVEMGAFLRHGRPSFLRRTRL